MSQAIKSDIIRAAGLIEQGHWSAVHNGRPSLVGATSAYATRAYVRETMAPGEYRNDGLRTNQTADDIVADMSPAKAAAALYALAGSVAA